MSSLTSASLCTIESLIHHPNADRLDLVEVQGCPAIVGRGEYTLNEQVVFIPFDVIIPDSEEFPDYVRGKRVRAVKLRGIFSMGVVLKNTWGFAEGDDIDGALGLTKYEPPVPGSSDGLEIPGPSLSCPKYDLESLRKYHSLLNLDEPVVITEKIHGANMRVAWHDGSLYVGSRTRWLEESESPWWRGARESGLSEKLKDLGPYVLYGEVYGQVQDLKYGVGSGEVKFVAFDLYNYRTGNYVDWSDFKDFCKYTSISAPPVIYSGPWKGLDAHKDLAEGQSLLAGHVREGFVVKPTIERYDAQVGRVAFKLHGEGYLTRKVKYV